MAKFCGRAECTCAFSLGNAVGSRPHPYQKAVDAFALCPFMPIKVLHSLVLQGVGGLFYVEKFLLDTNLDYVDLACLLEELLENRA